MPSWNELIEECGRLPGPAQGPWVIQKQTAALQEIGRLRQGTNVLFYASSFLQKPRAPAETISITGEEINGFMSVIHGMDWARPLTLLLHTPGGQPNAAETIVEYLRSKFKRIEVVVPTYAMSAGTMIALSADAIILGRQSQLGPIDPQMIMGSQVVSARAVVDQFEEAKKQILEQPLLAHAWAPVLQALGPALLHQARYALKYGESMVARWLGTYMFKGDANAKQRAEAVARHFNDASTHMSHGRRIGREEAAAQGLTIEALEKDQKLQDQVLTAYHLATITFEKSPTTKLLTTSQGRSWIKSWGSIAVQAGPS